MLLALALPFVAFALQGDVGLNLWDEGFLWYGTQRVLAGEVPLRDFQSYDVGRYYWSAAWSWLQGSDGIVAVRFGNAVLAAITGGLAALLLRASPIGSTVFASIGVVAVSLFVLQRAEATADAFAVVLLVAALAHALEAPQRARRWVACGAALGVAAAIGINHALYGVLGLGLAALHLLRDRGAADVRRAVPPLALGAVAGYAPVLALHALAPGFTAGFVDSIRILFEWGTTNLELPLFPSSAMLATLFFVGAAFGIVCVRLLLRGVDATAPGHAVFAAAVLMGIPYAHYAFSRADLEHASVSVLPILVAAASWHWRVRPALRSGVLLGVAMLAATLVLPRQPGRWALAGWPLEPTALHGETVRLKPWEAAEVALVRQLAAQHASDGRPFYAAPYWPGAYAVMGTRSPTWEIYALFPSTVARQQRELERLAAADIGFAVVSDVRVDDRSDLGFARTHPLLEAYLKRCLTPTPRPFEAEAIVRVQVYVDDGSPCDDDAP